MLQNVIFSPNVIKTAENIEKVKIGRRNLVIRAALAALFTLIMLCTVTACSSGANDLYSSTNAVGEAFPEFYDEVASYPEDVAMMSESETSIVSGETSSNANDYVMENTSEKIIYKSSVEMETLEFDTAIESINSLIKSHDAYIETSSVSGFNYNQYVNNNTANRTASYTIRIPVGKFTEFQSKIGDLGYIYNHSTSAENVSLQYFDLESRLTTYRTEEERLFVMLESAYTVEEMIAIEQRLSNVRYEIETLTVGIAKLDNLISYSTLNLYIREVEEYREPPKAAPITYGERMSSRFKDSLNNVWEGLKDFSINLVAAIPYLVILAIIMGAIIAVILIIVKNIKKAEKKRLGK